jgi:hypothetical protein
MALIVHISPIDNKKIRFSFMGSLIFCFLIVCCKSKTERSAAIISIEWKNDKPTGIIIPGAMIGTMPDEAIERWLHIRLAGNTTVILGNYSMMDDSVVFRTLIPFSRGLQYEIWLKDQLIGKIGIPEADQGDKPEIRAVYPTADTLPENVLKIHISFTKPMQEGESLKNILLIKNKSDTLRSVFLDLEPELWNNEKTELTLWLDPGRIKRDLQPNKKMGPPLREGEQYELIIGHDWQSADGLTLRYPYQKKFVVGPRDDQSPDPSRWTINSPAPGSQDALAISFHESLDYALLANTIRVIDDSGLVVKKTVTSISNNEREFIFFPSLAWKPGSYTVEIESRLEDLAGNNPERLFDTDLTLPKKTAEQKVFKRTFVIR